MKNIISRMFFGDATAIVRAADKKILHEEDLLPLPVEMTPSPRPEEDWSTKWRLIASTMGAARLRLTPAYVFYFISLVLSLGQPVLVNRFVHSVAGDLYDQWIFATAVGLALALGFTSLIRGVLTQHYFYGTLVSYIQIVNVINQRLFGHALRMSQNARLQTQVGDVVNHMSSDAETVADFSLVVAEMVYSVLVVIGVATMLFYYIGLSAVVPLILLALLAPGTRWVAKRFSQMDETLMKERDQRVTLMGQVLNAIRVIKYFGWERSIAREVREVRDRELAARRKMARAGAYAGVTYVAVSSVVLFSALFIHAWRGFELNPALVFTCVSLFTLLEEPFGSMSWTLSRWTNAFVSAGRIADFLRTEALAPHKDLPYSEDRALAVWLERLPRFNGYRAKFRAGESVALVGPVGGGKSMFLAGLLGEIRDDRARVLFVDREGREVHARTGYVPQESYIINGSLRENLLFGASGVDEQTIDKAVRAAGLDGDLRQLPAGYNTEIGEKGVNLSGGQKQRVNLARAVLTDPQVVFLDDPLSAVDVETERKICDRLLFGVWKDRTRIMTTHRLEHLAMFDRVLFIEGGRVIAEGTFDELKASNGRFQAFLRDHEKSHGAMSVTDQLSALDRVEKAESRITEDEEREVGAVKGSVYADYFRSLGGEGPWRNFNLFLLIAGAISVMTLPLLQRWWLGFASSFQQGQEIHGGPGGLLLQWGWRDLVADPMGSVYVYGALGVGALILNLGNNILWLERGLRAGQLMHQRMLNSLMKAQIRFFDATPVGRILQRFSRDVESVDVHLQGAFDQAIHILIQVLLCLALILVTVPTSAVFIIPILFVYYSMQNRYRRPAREVKRLDSIARSPRYAHFKETLVGLPVIRGMGREEWFLRNFYEKLTHSQRMFYNHFLLNRWFSSRIPLVGGGIAVATLVSVVMSCRSGYITPGTAGLLSIYMLSFWGYLNWGIRMFSDIESRMTSVERMRTYSSLPEEKLVTHSSHSPLADEWPSRGAVTFENVGVRYAPHLPLVLKGVSFSIKPAERVGIVGRTGSGKSTLFQALYRFVELDQGRILIDGEDIATVPLPRLRRALSIIPQDPTLFLGTIRSNLDRYDEYSDEEVIEALKKASMWDFVRELPGGLRAAVAENGLNLSQGQRQLLCLARALMTKAKVIVFDEATASVDVETDRHIQAVIQESLKDRTLLIIAHRLGTVSTCDKVIELADGVVTQEIVMSPLEPVLT